jgi:hypothetical protein
MVMVEKTKRRSSLIYGSCIVSAICLLQLYGVAFGYDITDKFSISGVLAGAWQYLEVNEEGVDDGPKAAVALQPEISTGATATIY